MSHIALHPLTERSVRAEGPSGTVVHKYSWLAAGAQGAANLSREYAMTQFAMRELIRPGNEFTPLRVWHTIIDDEFVICSEYVGPRTVWTRLTHADTASSSLRTLMVRIGAGIRRVHGLGERHASDPLPSANPETPLYPPVPEHAFRNLPTTALQFVAHHYDRHAELSRGTSTSPTHHTFIHGDFKADNILNPEDSDQLYAIDWERAGLGDPYEDLAAMLAAIFAARLVRAQAGFGSDNSTLAGRVHTALGSARELAASLLSGYGFAHSGTNTARLASKISDKLACRAQTMAAARGASDGLAASILSVAIAVRHADPEWALGRTASNDG